MHSLYKYLWNFHKLTVDNTYKLQHNIVLGTTYEALGKQGNLSHKLN